MTIGEHRESAGASGNAELDAMHRNLVGLAAALDRAIDDAPDAAAVRRLNARIAELNSRVTAVGRRLFASRTEELAVAAADVAQAVPRIERALADVARLDTALSDLTGVLGLVDKAIALADGAR